MLFFHVLPESLIFLTLDENIIFSLDLDKSVDLCYDKIKSRYVIWTQVHTRPTPAVGCNPALVRILAPRFCPFWNRLLLVRTGGCTCLWAGLRWIRNAAFSSTGISFTLLVVFPSVSPLFLGVFPVEFDLFCFPVDQPRSGFRGSQGCSSVATFKSFRKERNEK